MIVRAAGDGDLPHIGRIQSASPGASSWNPPEYLAYDCRVAIVDGEVAGFLVLRETGPQDTEILNLAVDPAFRRRGVAAELLRQGISARPGRVYLEVRASNQAARNLYRKLGFREVGVRSEYYAAPPEDGIVMVLQSC